MSLSISRKFSKMIRIVKGKSLTVLTDAEDYSVLKLKLNVHGSEGTKKNMA